MTPRRERVRIKVSQTRKPDDKRGLDSFETFKAVPPFRTDAFSMEAMRNAEPLRPEPPRAEPPRPRSGVTLEEVNDDDVLMESPQTHEPYSPSPSRSPSPTPARDFRNQPPQVPPSRVFGYGLGGFAQAFGAAAGPAGPATVAPAPTAPAIDFHDSPSVFAIVAPTPPMLPSDRLNPKKKELDDYWRRLQRYQLEWNEYSYKMATYMVERQQADALNTAAIFQSSTNLDRYISALQQDEKVRVRWNEALQSHKGVIMSFLALRRLTEGW
ncbi:uncharacterized protein V1510DRAFT_411999 [Dipodascopsis tothii]|uniref:uncharacterized protein n=1 Tax=Dipodascopsis tothii TaxID=44089 RepID=UPI0034CF7579